MTSGISMIEAERALQRAKWTDEHDDSHDGGELTQAAMRLLMCYVNAINAERVANGEGKKPYPQTHDWGLEEKHKAPMERLKIAGALIAAEIDRLERRGDKC